MMVRKATAQRQRPRQQVAELLEHLRYSDGRCLGQLPIATSRRRTEKARSDGRVNWNCQRGHIENRDQIFANRFLARNRRGAVHVFANMASRVDE